MSDAVKPDTNEAAVERAARILECDAARQDFHPPEMCGLDPADELEIAALLRTLLAERDAARAEVERLGRELNTSRHGPKHFGEDFHEQFVADLRAERDALRAQLADVLAENDAVRFQLNNALAPEPPHE